LRRSDFDPVYIENQKKQIKIFIFFVLAVFCILTIRLWFLQILKGPYYSLRSQKNRIHHRDIIPLRGRICDRNGDTLVSNSPAYDLKIIPEDIKDKDQLYNKLVSLLKIDSKAIKTKFITASKSNPFTPFCLIRDITRNEVAIIESHKFNLPGVIITVTPKRHYIYGDLAAHLLGHLGEINKRQLASNKYPTNKTGDMIGKAGVEAKWNRALTGIRGIEDVEVDSAGRMLRVLSSTPAIPGAKVTLTIDRRLQALAQRLLLKKKGAIVAIDPNNGEVLALASSPTFDPNIFVEGIDKKLWRAITTSRDFPLENRALCGQYPPASVFKVLVAIAALSEGIITYESKEMCKGVYSLGNRKFHCWKRYGHGEIDLKNALIQSCDIYFYKVGKKLGVDKIDLYAKSFGFGKITGIDVGHEKPGLLPTRSWKIRKFGVPWQQGETLGLSIGQSFMLVTPIQMAVFISAVFNGGILYTPHVTKKITFSRGKDIRGFETKSYKIKKLCIKKEYLDFVKKALIGVVNDPRGTGKKAAVPGILVAGKTGTAQVVTIENEKKTIKGKNRTHYKYVDHAWFVSVAPADKPRIALSIIIEHGGHGGSASAPIAKQLIEEYLAETGTYSPLQADKIHQTGIPQKQYPAPACNVHSGNKLQVHTKFVKKHP